MKKIPGTVLNADGDLRLIIPLYDVKMGGTPRAYSCGECGKPCHTQKGCREHLQQIHSLTAQMELFVDTRKTEET